jgi:large subunit ribosomal protein L4
MNRKERRLALRTAFASRIDDMIVVEDFGSQLQRPKTKELVSAIARWGAEPDKRVLLIYSENNQNLYLSARNIANVKVFAANTINIYDILHADKIIVTASAIDKIQEVFGA